MVGSTSSRRRVAVVLGVVLSSGACRGDDSTRPPAVGAATALLRAEADAGTSVRVNRDVLVGFYADHGGEPVWSREQARALLVAIERAPEHGLSARAHGVEALRAALGARARNRAALDLMLSDAFVSYADHLARGRLDPGALESDWKAPPREIDLAAALEAATRGVGVDRALAALSPPAPEYAALEQALARYRKLAWRPLATWSEAELALGASGPDVADLTSRLVSEGFLPAVTDQFDAAVDAAVREYQLRNGLPATGLVGRLTRAALAVPVEKRIEQIELNLERWRWLPRELGDRHLRVNIPSFTLEAYESGKRVLTMPVIVGKDYRRTPVFSGPITDVVLNPTWGVPRRLAVEDKLPKLQADPEYLEKNQISVVRGKEVVDPATIDWSTLSRDRFPYQLRQAAGPNNPLGELKFNIRNEFDVYLHDTNERSLFDRRERTLSSGCIRLKEPRRLAELVLETSGWSAEKIAAALATGETRRVIARAPRVELHLLYMTAWVADGVVQFRRDIDGRDKRLARALAKTGKSAR